MRAAFKRTTGRRVAAILLALAAAWATDVAAQEPANETEIRAEMRAAERLLGKTPDRASVLYLLAALHAQLGEIQQAMTNLRECVSLKEAFDPSGGPEFAALKGAREYDQLVEQAHKDFPAVNQARLTYITTEKDLVPEGLAYDSARNAFYLGSLNLRKIVKIPGNGVIKAPIKGAVAEKSSDFVPSDRYKLLPILGIRMDPGDGSVWSNSCLDEGKSELLHFDPEGTLLGRYLTPEPGKHCFNDLVVLPSGEVFLTDTLANKLLQFQPKTQTFSETKVSRELLEPNGITVSRDNQLLYVADQLGVLRVDLKSGESVEVDAGPHSTLAGIDGLYWHKGSLIAIQNGIGTPRVAAFQLARDGAHVSKTTILEYRSNLCVLPTTGALREDDFYYIVNSGSDNLNTNGRVLDVTKLEPVRIAVIHLP
jgi:DNA-binding beta-propeller fold protein YncE